MKPIKLSEKQKDNLLEMAKKLFPELLIDEDTYIDDNGILSTNLKVKENCYKELEIHWFEFCLNELANKLLSIDKEDIIDYDFWANLITSSWQSHPIDYLYTEFKKLNL